MMHFDPFADMEALHQKVKAKNREALRDMKAFKNLARSESGKRVIRILKELCDYDGPVHRRNENTGRFEIEEGIHRDGFRAAIAVIVKNAALAETIQFGKDAGA